MKKRQIIAEIDGVLETYQFSRVGATWNRAYADYVDVIDVQISKSRMDFAVNLGIADKFVTNICWDIAGSSLVDESSCTIRCRLGQLLSNKDKWWSVDGEDEIGEVASAIRSEAIPYFERNHNVDRMIEIICNNYSSKTYPPESLYLALLYYRKGDRVRGIEMLKAMQLKLTDGWREKVTQILDRLS